MSLAFLGKKSFNPTNIKNQEKVWLAEKAHDEEQKHLAELQKQIAEEREIRELQELQGGIKEDRIDWMYEGPMSGAVHAEDEAKKAEEYLLGKAFELPKHQNEETTLAVTGGSGALTGGNSAANIHVAAAIKQLSANEMFRRMHEDPLLRMRQAEKSSKARIMANPLKMRKIHMEADAIARAKKRAKKLKKAAKKVRKKEMKEECRRSLGSKKRERHDSSTESSSKKNEDGNFGSNVVRKESSNSRSKHHKRRHHESTARKSSGATEDKHRLESNGRNGSNVKTQESNEYRRYHDRDRERYERRQHSGRYHYHGRDITVADGRDLPHVDKYKGQRDDNEGRKAHKIDKTNNRERDDDVYNGRQYYSKLDKTYEEKDQEKVVTALHKGGTRSDARYGLMNCNKKDSYKAKDLGPDEDLLRKSTEKAKAEEAEKAAARVRKNTQMTYKEKILLAKEMESDGRKHEVYTIEKSKEYERQRKEENEKMKIGRGGEENGKERDGAGNFLNEIEKTALTSITVHDRIAARKHYQQRHQDAESFMQR